MGKLWAIIKREYLERVRTKWFIIATFFGPLLLGLMIIVPAWLGARSMRSGNVSRIVVVDASGRDLGARVASALAGGALGDTTLARVQVVAPGGVAEAESLLTRRVMADSLRGYLVVDAGTVQFARARYAGRNATSLPDMQRIERAVQQSVLSLRLEGEGLDATRIQQLTNVKSQVRAERITEEGRGGSGQISIVFAFAVAFLLYMLIVLYGQTIMRGVMEEKTTRVAEVVVASAPTDTLLAGKVLGVGAVGLTQQVLWTVLTVLIYQARTPVMRALGAPQMELPVPDISIGLGLLLIAFFALGFVFYASLFAAVGSTVNNEQDAQQAATPVTMLIIISAIFIQPVVLNPTSTLSQVLSWVPFSAPIIMPIRLSLVPIPWYELAGVIAGMIVACVAAVWLASKIYRVGLLMYGKRPTWGELAKWVRAS